MTYPELEKATMDSLISVLSPKLKAVIDDLVVKGYLLSDIQEVIVRITRRVAGCDHTLTELSVLEYIDRIARGEIQPRSRLTDRDTVVE